MNKQLLNEVKEKASDIKDFGLIHISDKPKYQDLLDDYFVYCGALLHASDDYPYEELFDLEDKMQDIMPDKMSDQEFDEMCHCINLIGVLKLVISKRDDIMNKVEGELNGKQR